MNAPRISVICIFFNEERFLVEAVESVLAQDYDDYELLLVDDGSTDASTSIARDYANRLPERVGYLEHDGHANRGMSATRNLGLAHASGEYVAFIDADDRWRPPKLREQAAILDTHPDVGILCGTVNYWSSWEGGPDRLVPTGRPIDAISRPPETTLALYPLGSAAAPCPSDVMMRRAMIDAIGGFEDHFTGPLQMYEDQALFAKAYLATNVYFASRVWLDYRIHAASCVERVTRSGGYRGVRRYFLDWFAGYIGPRPVPGKEAIARELRRARRGVAHPNAARIRRSVGRVARFAASWRRRAR